MNLTRNVGLEEITTSACEGCWNFTCVKPDDETLHEQLATHVMSDY